MTVRDSLRTLNDVGDDTVRAQRFGSCDGIERIPPRHRGRYTAERLYGIRTSYGYTLTEAAEKVGVTAHTLRNAERGMAIGRKTLTKLAQLYGVSVDWLCGTEGR